MECEGVTGDVCDGGFSRNDPILGTGKYQVIDRERIVPSCSTATSHAIPKQSRT